jgi:hypothetical protein
VTTAAEILAANAICLAGTAPGQHYTTCPQCSANRKLQHQKLECLGVKIDGDGVTWFCNHCEWTGRGYFNNTEPNRRGADKHIVKTYDYTGADGGLIYQVCRLVPKGFSQRRPVPGEASRWIWGLSEGRYIRGRNGNFYAATKERVEKWRGAEQRDFDATPHMLYRFPELRVEMAQDPDERRMIFVCEGERDCDTLTAWDLVSTTNSGGAKKWRAHHAEELRGADVVVMADNDDAGQAHGQLVAASLKDVAARVRVLNWPDHWPGAPEGADITDWRDQAGGTADKLFMIVDRLRDWEPQADGGASFDRDTVGNEPPPDKPWRQNVLTAKELRTMTFNPITFLVSDLIPAEGITLICAKPKVGKSWLLLDLCIAATADRHVLGDLKPVQGDVLYLALEDSPRRLHSRMTKLLPTFTGDWPSGLTLATQWRRVDQGGLDDVRGWVETTRNKGGKIAFVGIDVLKMVRPLNQGRKLAYDCDYEAITGLHKLAIELSVPIIVVHHTRKAEAEDLIDKVSGTFGLVGAADTIIVIERRSHGWVFDVRGRDVTADELAVEFNSNTCRWTILGNAQTVHRSAERGAVMAIFGDAEGPLTVADVTERLEVSLPQSQRSAAAVRQILSRMAKNGDLRRLGKGKYALLVSSQSQSHNVTREGEETEPL